MTASAQMLRPARMSPVSCPPIPKTWQSSTPLAELTYHLQSGVRPRGASPAGMLIVRAKSFAPGEDGRLFQHVGNSIDDALVAARDVARRSTAVPTAVFGSAAVMQAQDGDYWITVLTGSHGGQVASPMIDGPRFGEFVKGLTTTPLHADLRAIVGGDGFIPVANRTVLPYSKF